VSVAGLDPLPAVLDPLPAVLDPLPAVLDVAGKVNVPDAQLVGCSATTTSTPTSELNRHTANPAPESRHE
jgi:hypothetical protein